MCTWLGGDGFTFDAWCSDSWPVSYLDICAGAQQGVETTMEVVRTRSPGAPGYQATHAPALFMCKDFLISIWKRHRMLTMFQANICGNMSQDVSK